LELAPFVADKDVHEVTFVIDAGTPLALGSAMKRTIKINAVTRAKGVKAWKIDYSTGVFFNVGSNAFLGPSYYFDTNEKDTTKTAREAPKSKKGMLSVGALLHVYPRWLGLFRFIKPAATVGVSTTTGFTAVNLHMGLSALIGSLGNASRLTLSAGWTAREVGLFDDSRHHINIPDKTYGDAVPTSPHFPVWGKFIAITYNLKGPSK
jgi:hypothetical protein